VVSKRLAEIKKDLSSSISSQKLSLSLSLSLSISMEAALDVCDVCGVWSEILDWGWDCIRARDRRGKCG